MSNWVPSTEALTQIVRLLQNSQSPDLAVQQNIHHQLQTFNNIPDYFRYLVYIFAKLRDESENLRMIAGLLLKNNIKEHYHRMPEDVRQYIKNEILLCIGDPKPSIRKTVASIITTIVVKAGFEGWPGLLQALIQFLDSQDLNYVDGSLNAFVLICEDYAEKLDTDEPSTHSRPLNTLIPKFLGFFRSPHEEFRKHALSCINQFIIELPAALLVNMDPYLQGLFFLTGDSSSHVRKRVCQAFVTLVEVRIDYLMPYIRNVIQFMMHATQDQNENVALEACEFWSAIAETKGCKDVLRSFLPSLIPLLLDKMVYSEYDIEQLGEDDTVPDNPKDIRPFLVSSKSRGMGSTSGSNEASGENEDEDEDEDEDWDEDMSEWNLRKCSAAGVDILSTVFQDELLPTLLPLLQVKLNDKENWKARESAILALGAVAEGCSRGMKDHLPVLVPYLLSLLSDSQPLIRSITCWTLSRYARWIVRQEDQNKYLRPLIMELLNRILDRNKKVQEAACSAFATLEEEAQTDLVPYLDPILRCLMTAFTKYQAKNLLILYDAIGTLADSVGSDLNTNENINILIPPLINKWNTLPDDDKNLFPLLQCLTSIAAALGVGFQPFTPPVYQRCIRLIETTLIKEAMARQNQGEQPDREFMICALDLISGIADGLGPSIESLIGNSNIVNLLFECMKESRPDVRQSSFALVGDLAKCCVGHLKPLLHEYIPILVNNLVVEYIPVCNNACWALGEIALRIGEEIKPFTPMILDKLIPLMNKQNLNRNMLENTAITLGRLGFACPDILAPRLEEFLVSWCLTLRNVRDDLEKDSAFRGLVKLVKANPNAAGNHFMYVCDAIASWDRLKQDLREMFHQLLHGFKTLYGNQWQNYFATFPDPLQKILRERYF